MSAQSPAPGRLSSEVWGFAGTTSPQTYDLLLQVAHFLQQLGYNKSVSSLIKEASSRSIQLNPSEWVNDIEQQTHFTLPALWHLWHETHGAFPVVRPIATSSGSSSDSDMDSDSGSDSDTGSESSVSSRVDTEAASDSDSSDSDSENEVDIKGSSKAKRGSQPGQKRKRATTPSTTSNSSSSESDSSSDYSSSSDGDLPPTKRARVSSETSDTNSVADTSDDSSVSDSSSGSSGGSASISGSDSDDSESEDEDEGESASALSHASAKHVKSGASSSQNDHNDGRATSDSSATVVGDSTKGKPGKKAPSGTGAESSHHGMHPSRAARIGSSKADVRKKSGDWSEAGKKVSTPFSRIPKDQQVDPRFASNAYVPYDYADRAHRDLIVTRGKGFTKEKNKKKRGSYHGGVIDLAPKAIKFED